MLNSDSKSRKRAFQRTSAASAAFWRASSAAEDDDDGPPPPPPSVRPGPPTFLGTGAEGLLPWAGAAPTTRPGEEKLSLSALPQRFPMALFFLFSRGREGGEREKCRVGIDFAMLSLRAGTGRRASGGFESYQRCIGNECDFAERESRNDSDGVGW